MRYDTKNLFLCLASFAFLAACEGGSFSGKSSQTLHAPTDEGDAAARDEGSAEAKDDGMGQGISPEEAADIQDRCGKKDRFETVIRLNGNQEEQTIRLAHSALIIQNGNMSRLTVEGLESEIAEICILMRGNEGTLAFTADKAIGTVAVFQHGNQNEAALHLKATVRSFSWDAAGNENKTSVDGDGPYTCPTADSKGNANTLTCKAP